MDLFASICSTILCHEPPKTFASSRPGSMHSAIEGPQFTGLCRDVSFKAVTLPAGMEQEVCLSTMEAYFQVGQDATYLCTNLTIDTVTYKQMKTLLFATPAPACCRWRTQAEIKMGLSFLSIYGQTPGQMGPQWFLVRIHPHSCITADFYLFKNMQGRSVEPVPTLWKIWRNLGLQPVV